jgi:hypothetical protein
MCFVWRIAEVATKETFWILHPKPSDLGGINIHMLNFISQSFYKNAFYMYAVLCITYSCEHLYVFTCMANISVV